VTALRRTPTPVGRMSTADLLLQARALIKKVDAARYDWHRHARPEQLEPEVYFAHLILAGRGWGKALGLDTLIPTAQNDPMMPHATAAGWTKMGDLAVGDRVFDESGRPCTVTAVFDRTPEVAYRLHFSDGTTIDACDEHQWVTWTYAERKAYLRSQHEPDRTRFPEDWPAWRVKQMPPRWLSRGVVDRALELQALGLSQRAIEAEVHAYRASLLPHLRAGRYLERTAVVRKGSLGPRIRTTQDIVDTLTYGKRGDLNHCIPTAGPLQLPEADLPIDPWLLGYWLGNGQTTAAQVTSDVRDALEVEAAIRSVGFTPTIRLDHAHGQAGFSIPGGFRRQLTDSGLRGDKHVPEAYLWASESQREALLAGLMDSDGYCGLDGSVEFSSTLPHLADAVVQLARSLGQKPVLAEGRAMLEGRDYGPKYRVTWRPTRNPFRLSRKGSRVRPGGAQGLRNHHRMIVAAERIEPVPMRCITVDSPHSMFLAGEGMIPTHNTRVGSETVRKWATARRGHYAVVAKNDREVRRICFEARRAGLLAVIPEELIAKDGYRKGSGDTMLTLTNGSIIRAFSAEQPDNLRGYAFDGVWCDEMAAWSRVTAQDVWDNLMFCLREAPEPHVIVTTTPKNVPHVRDLVARAQTEAGFVITRGHTEDNRANLSPVMLAQLERDYAGTRLGRQELGGELLEDVEHALWSLELIAAATWRFDAFGPLPELTRVVTSVDPSGSEKGDATGIVTVARARPPETRPVDEQGEYVAPVRRIGSAPGDPVETGPILVLSDATTQGTPEHRYSTACLEAYRHSAGVILVEGAYGGDNVMAADVPMPRLAPAPANGSKADRAEPVVGLYEQTANGGQRIFHAGPAGALAALEDEMTTWEPDSKWSPNRIDAMVHGVRYLTNTAGYQSGIGSAVGLRPVVGSRMSGRRRR
jgi:phage terminase large subunit-like protein